MKLIVAIVVVALGCVLVAAGITWHALRPLDAPARTVMGPSVVAVNTGRSLAYVVTTNTGVVLVDSGSDASAKALQEELTRAGKSLADVRAVLLTSPHPFVLGGLDALKEVPVYVGQEDVELVRRNAQAHAWLARACDRWMFRGKRKRPFESVLAGHVLQIDGVTFEAVAIPGASRGARAYLANGVAFIGPTLERSGLPSRWFAEAPADVPRSLQRLTRHEFQWLAASTFVRDDGHTAIDALLTGLNHAAFAAAPR